MRSSPKPSTSTQPSTTPKPSSPSQDRDRSSGHRTRDKEREDGAHVSDGSGRSTGSRLSSAGSEGEEGKHDGKKSQSQRPHSSQGGSAAAPKPRSQHQEPDSRQHVRPATPARRGRREPSSSSSDEDEGGHEHGELGGLLGLVGSDWRYAMYQPSASFRQLDVVTGCHQYTISGYSLARALGTGTRLCSDLFDAGGQMFRVEVYPSGFTADTSRFLSLFLTTPGAVAPQQILYEVGVLDQSGRDEHIMATRSVGDALRRVPLMAHHRGVVAAFPRLVRSRALRERAHQFLPGDMLVIRATVQVLQGWSSTPGAYPVQDYSSSQAAQWVGQPHPCGMVQAPTMGWAPRPQPPQLMAQQYLPQPQPRFPTPQAYQQQRYPAAGLPQCSPRPPLMYDSPAGPSAGGSSCAPQLLRPAQQPPASAHLEAVLTGWGGSGWGRPGTGDMESQPSSPSGQTFAVDPCSELSALLAVSSARASYQPAPFHTLQSFGVAGMPYRTPAQFDISSVPGSYMNFNTF